jgi:hypothetical protein
VAIVTSEHRAQTAATQTVTDWIQLIRSEYLEMPGMSLTRAQIRRFWNLDGVICDATLNALMDVKFLRRTARGTYVRTDGGVS